MKITVIGASGLLGTKVVDLVTAAGPDVVTAPSSEDEAVMDFFNKSTTNLVGAAKHAGVGHYVALSIVGLDGLPDSGYMRAKVAQEKILTESGLPYSIVRAT